MARKGGLLVGVLGIAALAATFLLNLPAALGAVDLMVPRTGAVEFDLGTALITVAAVLVFVGIVEAARPRAR